MSLPMSFMLSIHMRVRETGEGVQHPMTCKMQAHAGMYMTFDFVVVSHIDMESKYI